MIHAAAPQAALRSFTDLRRFAADDGAGLWLRAAADADAFPTSRRRIVQSHGAEVGAIDLPEGQGRVDGITADEFVIVCDGALSPNHGAGTTELREGASRVLCAGMAFSWRAEQPTRLVYMRHACAGGQAARVVTIDASALLRRSGTPPRNCSSVPRRRAGTTLTFVRPMASSAAAPGIQHRTAARPCCTRTAS